MGLSTPLKKLSCLKLIFLWKRMMQRCLKDRKIIIRNVDQEGFIYLFKYRHLNFCAPFSKPC